MKHDTTRRNLPAPTVPAAEVVESRRPLELVSQLSQRDHQARQMNKRLKYLDFMLIANDQSTEIADPADRAFDFPATAVASKLPTILQFRFAAVAPVRTDQIDAASPQPLSQRIGIGRLVVNQPFRILFRPSASFPRNSNLLQRRFDQGDFVRRRRGKLYSQRHTLAIRHHHKLCTLSTFGLSDAFAPFFAGENVPSAKHSCHFSCPAASSVPSNARHASNKTPASSHACNRRQQVLAEGKCLGKSFQRAPLRKTQSIPSKQGRLGTGFGPPLADASGSGSNGSITAHCSSETSKPVWYSFFATKRLLSAAKHTPESVSFDGLFLG